MVHLVNGQFTDCSNFPDQKATKVAIIPEVGGFFNGLLEYKPVGYDDPANAATTYPIIIFFHGVAGIGTGSNADLCRILNDTSAGLSTADRIARKGFSLPNFLERDLVPASTADQYIVLAPQYDVYNFPSSYPSDDAVAAFLAYAQLNYRIDLTKIYLTGLSTGANMVIDYLSSSQTRAETIAAASVASLCAPVAGNPGGPAGPSNIRNSGVAVWFMACNTDLNCNPNITRDWVTAIGTPSNIRTTILGTTGEQPCINTAQDHNTWGVLYDPAFPGPGPTIYTYFDQIILPVKLKEYYVNLSDNRVHIKWTTSNETDNANFVVERSGPDQQFSTLATIEGSGSSTVEQQYQYTDERPLSGLSFYRLVQIDIDGKKTHFETRRIVNLANNKRLIVTPNPFSSNVSAFVTLDRKQRVIAYITDMSGRRLATQSGEYAQGTSEITLQTSNLPKGIYLLKIEAEGFSEVQRVIKR